MKPEKGPMVRVMMQVMLRVIIKEIIALCLNKVFVQQLDVIMEVIKVDKGVCNKDVQWREIKKIYM